MIVVKIVVASIVIIVKIAPPNASNVSLFHIFAVLLQRFPLNQHLRSRDDQQDQRSKSNLCSFLQL